MAEQLVGLREELAVRHHAVSAAQRAEQHGGDGPHARAAQDGDLGALEGGEPRLDGCHRRVAEALIEAR
jgi:hypothetical protein